MTSVTPVLHRLVISTGSLPRTLGLYEGALGLRRERTAEGVAWLRSGAPAAGGVEVMLHERPTHPSDAAVAPVFALPALDATVDRWVAAGGEVVDPPAQQTWGERMAVVRDADGHLLCLVERP